MLLNDTESVNLALIRDQGVGGLNPTPERGEQRAGAIRPIFHFPAALRNSALARFR